MDAAHYSIFASAAGPAGLKPSFTSAAFFYFHISDTFPDAWKHDV